MKRILSEHEHSLDDDFTSQNLFHYCFASLPLLAFYRL
jgi:hypothetical protein